MPVSDSYHDSLIESLKDSLDTRLRDLPEGTSVLLVGHSMGGALAQLAAAYYAHLTPWLVTFAAPAVGNGAFCQHLRQYARPFGGIRVWNEFDAVPYLPLLVGYEHTGVPVKLKLKTAAKDLFPRTRSRGVVKKKSPNPP